jgi:hypothetical protein
MHVAASIPVRSRFDTPSFWQQQDVARKGGKKCLAVNPTVHKQFQPVEIVPKNHPSIA